MAGPREPVYSAVERQQLRSTRDSLLACRLSLDLSGEHRTQSSLSWTHFCTFAPRHCQMLHFTACRALFSRCRQTSPSQRRRLCRASCFSLLHRTQFLQLAITSLGRLMQLPSSDSSMRRGEGEESWAIVGVTKDWLVSALNYRVSPPTLHFEIYADEAWVLWCECACRRSQNPRISLSSK